MSNGHLIQAWFDGACEPVNPNGFAAYGVLIKVDGKPALAEGVFVGAGEGMSNNVAEYAGMCRVLDWLAMDGPPGIVQINGDSKLVVMQIIGAWRVKGGYYLPYAQRAAKQWIQVVQKYDGNVAIRWVPRDKNAECDRLSKKVLLDRGIKFRIQPKTIVPRPTAEARAEEIFEWLKLMQQRAEKAN